MRRQPAAQVAEIETKCEQRGCAGCREGTALLSECVNGVMRSGVASEQKRGDGRVDGWTAMTRGHCETNGETRTHERASTPSTDFVMRMLQ